jgi:hemoglobin
LQRFWTSPRSIDTNNRERQLLVDFISASAGGPTFYLGRDMKTSHKGMGIDQDDYTALKKHLVATLEKFNVPEREREFGGNDRIRRRFRRYERVGNAVDERLA